MNGAILYGLRERKYLITFFQVKPLNLQHLMMDAALLLPPTGTPLTGIEFYKRLPCGEVEHTRRVRRIY